MLTTFLDRVGTASLLYATIATLCYQLHSDTFPFITAGIFLTSTLWVGRVYIIAIRAEYNLDALGSRAPSIRTWTPWNIGVVIQAVYFLERGRLHDMWARVMGADGSKAHVNTVEMISTGRRLILTVDEENIKAILATQFTDYGKGPAFRREWKDFLGLSIFTTDGEMWRHSRSMLRPSFVKDRLSDLETFEKHVQILLPKLGGAHNGATVQADNLFFRFTLDAATDFLLGKSVDSLANGQADFADAFTEVQRVQGLAARAGALASLVPRTSFHKSLAIVNNFVGHYIEKALRLPPEELAKVTKSDHGYTFLHELASYTRDPSVLRDQIIAVLLAGRDTTAVTLSWLFYELSRNAAVVTKLRDEILSVVGPTRAPTYSDLKSMRYLRHVIDETLRLYPVVPYNTRSALQDTTLPRGGGKDGSQPIGVQKDTEVAYSTFCLQRRPELYPAASEEFPHYLTFAPERWETWHPSHWAYLPFNGGPRICIGQQFALTEMAYTIVRILQHYDRVENRMEEFPGFRSDIVLQPAKEVNVGFFKDARHAG